MPKTKSNLPPKSIGGLAERWGVGERTIKRLRAQGCPFSNDAKALAWLRQQANVPPVMIDRGNVLAETPAKTPPSTTDGEWKTFLAQITQDAADEPKHALREVKAARDLASFRFMESAKTENRQDMRLYADLLAKFDGVVHDAETRAKKLGIDQGELLPRAEVARIIRAWAFWTMRSVDLTLDPLCVALVGISSVEEVRKVLEPFLLSNRFARPFAAAAKIASESAMPPWFVEVLVDSLDDFLEFDPELYAEFGLTPPKQPAVL